MGKRNRPRVLQHGREAPTSESPVDAPKARDLREPVIVAAGIALLLALYLGFPERIYVFDGIQFASVIERAYDFWRESVFNPRHLLFNPAMMLVRDSLLRAGIAVDGYTLMQRVNAVLGAAGALIFYRLALRLTKDKGLAAVAAALLALSASYWGRATEGQVYMTMTFFGLVTASLAVAQVEAPSILTAALCLVALIAAILFHTVNVVLLPMVLLVLWLSWRTTGRHSYKWAIPAILLAGAVPFVVYFRLYSPSAFLAFLIHATEAYSPGQPQSWSQLGRHFFGADRLSLSRLAGGVTDQLYSSLLFHEGGGAATLLGQLAAGSAIISTWVLALREPERRATALVLAAWWLGYVAMEQVWGGGEFFWAAPLAAFLAAYSLVASRLVSTGRLDRRALLVGATALALSLGVWNFRDGILPRSDVERNPSYRHSLFVRDHTLQVGRMVISGFGESNLKPYLPYFAHRSPAVVELYLNSTSTAGGLQSLSKKLQAGIANGRPTYLLSDLAEDPRVDAEFQRRWGITSQQVRACLGPGKLMPIASSDPSFRIFLFLPRDRMPELFSMLVFGAMGETNPALVDENLHLIAAISAKVLTPPQLDRALRTLRESDYGAVLYARERFEVGTPEAQTSAAADLEKLRAFRTTADFHVRLGTIYAAVGVLDDARRELSEAYRMTNDPKIAALLAQLPQPTPKGSAPRR